MDEPESIIEFPEPYKSQCNELVEIIMQLAHALWETAGEFLPARLNFGDEDLVISLCRTKDSEDPRIKQMLETLKEHNQLPPEQQEFDLD